MAKTLFIVVKSLLAFAGIEVSEDTAKQIRQVCTWANVKATFPVLEDAVMDFYMLSLKYWRQLHKCGVHSTDDWLARNMVKAFRQNRDENKFGGVVGLLQAYITQEATMLLKGEVSSVDFHLDPTKKTFEDHINNWILKGILVNVKAEDLRVRLATLFNLAENQVIIRTSKEGVVESFRLVLAAEKKINSKLAAIAAGKSIPGYDENQEPANIDDQNFVEQETAAEDVANGADAVGESIGSGETCAVMDSTTMPVGPLAQNPLADVAKPAKRTVVSAIIQKGAEKLEPVGTTLAQFKEKYPDKDNITGFPVGLAQTAELRHRKDKAQEEDPKCEYWKLKMLSREEIVDMLYNESHEFDWLRDVALGKIPAKKTATTTTSSDKFEKEYFVLHMFVGEDGVKHYERVAEMPSLETMKKIRTIQAKDRKEDYYNLRLWIDTKSKNPAGFVYTGDDAKHPFMKFYWGFQNNGLSFPTPMVQKRDQKGSYSNLSEELKDIKSVLKKALEDKGYKPTYRAPGAVKPGITMQYWGNCGVMNS